MNARVGTARGSDNLARMRRATALANGVEGMIREGRDCADIMARINAARSALQTVARAILDEHAKTCRAAAIRSGGTKVHDMYQALIDLVSRMAE